MSQRCHFRREAGSPSCPNASKGSIGMLRLCPACFAQFVGWPADDPRLKQRCLINLFNGDDPTFSGQAEWVPDVAISRERLRAAR